MTRGWDPFRELEGVHKRMNELFERALARSDFDAPGSVGSWVPEADVYETPDALVVELELPGLDHDAIELRVDDDELIVEGERKMQRGSGEERFHRVERRYGRFARRFRLPSTVDRESVEARFRNGVLTVSLGRRQQEQPKPIKVPIS